MSVAIVNVDSCEIESDHYHGSITASEQPCVIMMWVNSRLGFKYRKRYLNTNTFGSNTNTIPIKYLNKNMFMIQIQEIPNVFKYKYQIFANTIANTLN